MCTRAHTRWASLLMLVPAPGMPFPRFYLNSLHLQSHLPRSLLKNRSVNKARDGFCSSQAPVLAGCVTSGKWNHPSDPNFRISKIGL